MDINEILKNEPEDLYNIVKCPICGIQTLDNYFICPLCGWEYDGKVLDEEYSEANKSTVKEYRNEHL